MTCLRLLGPEAKAGQGLLGEDESEPRQDREEPGGGKDLGDEAVRQRTEKKALRRTSPEPVRDGEVEQETGHMG